MPITIDWGQSIIHVPRDYMILVQTTPVEVRQLNIDEFRKVLNDLQDSPEGMPFPTTHNHVAPISVGGVDLARVVEVLQPYTITFEDGQYAVNLVGANSNIADRTNVNQVSVRSANSAGLPDLTAIQATSFQTFVTVQAGSQYSGTTYPVGTSGYPVNNIPDAALIAEKYFLDKIRVIGDYTFDTGDDISGFSVYGQNPLLSSLTILPGAQTYGASFYEASITGTLDGAATIRYSRVVDLVYFSGFIYESSIEGTITLGGGAQADILGCYSGVAGAGTWTLDMGGSGQSLTLRKHSGGVTIQNKTGTEGASIDLIGGQVKLDLTTVTNGMIVVRGTGKVVDAADDTNWLPHGYYGSMYLANETTYGHMLADLWTLNGLDPDVPVTHPDDGTKTTRTAGDITQEITDTTLTRI